MEPHSHSASAPRTLWQLSIAEAARKVESGAISPVELTEAALSRILAVDGRLNAFITVTAETAMRQARKAAQEIRAGRQRGPLHGIPVAVKDVFETAGVPTTAHSSLLREHMPRRDSNVVQKLAAAGAILLGKLATHEFAIGGPSFELPWPPARNPWDIERFTGGSSSGPGAAVAAGMIAGAVGTDTSGSIRHPAAYCGVAGFKPSFGLVGRSGAIPLAPTLDHCGPLAWTVEDCALLMDVLAGLDPGDPASIPPPPEGFARDVRGGIAGMRIGVVRRFYETDLPATEVATNAFEEALRVLRDLGATLAELTLPPLSIWDECTAVIAHAEGYALHRNLLRRHGSEYAAITRQQLMLGANLTEADYLCALRLRAHLAAAYHSALDGLDVLATLCSVGPAEPLAEIVAAPPDRPRGRFISTPFSLLGAPALVTCAGFTTEGLPLSFQIAGRPGEDVRVLRTGCAYERATPWRERRPPI